MLDLQCAKGLWTPTQAVASHHFLFSLLKDCCLIKPHFWLQGCFLSYPSCYSQSYSGKHLGDSVSVNNREAGQQPIHDEIRNKSLEKKTGVCRGQKKSWEEGKETPEQEHPLPSLPPNFPIWSLLNSPFFSCPPMSQHSLPPDNGVSRVGVQSQLLQPAPLPVCSKGWHLASATIVTTTTSMQD